MLLTVREAAERMSVSENTVRRLISKGELPASKIGRAVRVDEVELAAWIRSARVADIELPRGPIRPPQLKALYAKCDALARLAGISKADAKAAALQTAATRFDKDIESSLDLDEYQASYVLEWLEREIVKATR